MIIAIAERFQLFKCSNAALYDNLTATIQALQLGECVAIEPWLNDQMAQLRTGVIE